MHTMSTRFWHKNRYDTLSCHDPAIIGDHQMQLFTTGLGQLLRTDVVLQKSATLDVSVMDARAYA
jgi:hypothetical protein